MDLPQGYALRKVDFLPPNVVLRLKKSNYDLKKVFLKFSTTLVSLGFQKINGDYTLFLSVIFTSMVLVLVYVDDIIIANTTKSDVSKFVIQLHACFKLIDLGPPKYFLGIEIARSASIISICQHKYVLEMFLMHG